VAGGGCAARITAQHGLPVLETTLHQFPFRVRGFRTDNGSESVNKDVAGLLKDLLAAPVISMKVSRAPLVPRLWSQ
jgi:hypothetical protein